MLLKEYLLNALQLEVSKQNQTQAIADAEKSLNSVTPRMPKEPRKPENAKEPERKQGKLRKPTPPDGIHWGKLFMQLILLAGVTAFALWMFKLVKDLFGTFGQGEWNMFYVLALSIGTCGSVALDIYAIKSLIETITMPRWEKRTYPERLRAYEEEQEVIDKEYQAELAEYERVNAAYERDLRQYRRQKESAAQAIIVNKQTVQKAIAEMKDKRSETEAVLKQYYDVDIVHPKYRTVSALTAICEYLDTGRCTALTGPNGAYNLYEAEYRQDLILSKLDTVISKLEKIEQNQVLMLKQLQNLRNSTDSMSNNVKALLSSTQKIEKLSYLTAYCSAVTAVNTAAAAYYAKQVADNSEQLKYIALTQ